jgi:hypothetical protein
MVKFAEFGAANGNILAARGRNYSAFILLTVVLRGK